jgi:hypothetical protein
MTMSSNIIWGSEAIRLEHEAILAEQAALLAEFSDYAKYCQEMSRLNALLRRYSHRWVVYRQGERVEPSQRMYDWVDRYNTLTRSPNFHEWCEEICKAFPHDAYDVLS